MRVQVHSRNGITLLRYRKLIWIIQESVLKLNTRTKQNIFIRCRQTGVIKKTLRNLCAKISDKKVHHALSVAMVLLTRFAMESVALNDIQRVVRGFLGRVDAKVGKIALTSITRIESHARGFIQRNRFVLHLLQRIHAAIDAQRCMQ